MLSDAKRISATGIIFGRCKSSPHLRSKHINFLFFLYKKPPFISTWYPDNFCIPIRRNLWWNYRIWCCILLVLAANWLSVTRNSFGNLFHPRVLNKKMGALVASWYYWICYLYFVHWWHGYFS